MKQEENYKISLAESALKGKATIAQQPAITFVQALQQAQRLKQHSNIEQKLKKSRVNY